MLLSDKDSTFRYTYTSKVDYNNVLIGAEDLKITDVHK